MRERRAQASIDMLVAYGIAILITSIAIYVILQLGVFNTRLAPTYCNAAPSFSCAGYAIATNGLLTMVFSQSTGATLNVTGVACSTQPSNNATAPRFGNIGVTPSSAYYASGQWNSIIVYSSNNTRISMYCYGPSGFANGQLGNGFTGYVWINYTVSSLPSNYHNIQQMASVSAKYT
ncbi:MAG: hypothetical protein ABSA33_01315 [Candidatus Micrarchaeaceae archaeon]|jgi:uncharacterized protein (UPF0333 family)